jgi:phosphonate transport system substrate-binding protein
MIRHSLFRPAFVALVGSTALLAALATPAATAASTSTKKTTTTKKRPGATAPATTTPTPAKDLPTLKIATIPDQDPAKLQRQFTLVSQYFATKTGLKVEYVPVTEYAAAVSGYRIGDLDLVWFGGLTGVQAAKQLPGSIYVAQRDIDAKFKSVFIANASFKAPPIDSVGKLQFVKGESLTFGSEISTSGRLMPQFFLDEAGLDLSDFKGQPGFSGSHDKTIRLVESGTYTIGALNKAVWDSNVANNTVDTSKVRVIFETPSYYDYHWLARPETDKKFGSGTTAKLQAAILGLNKDVPEQKAILDLFSATSFIDTKADNYGQIEKTAKRLGLL